MVAFSLDVFAQAARDLEEAAVQYGGVAAEADDVAQVHATLAGSARVAATDARRRADKIKELVA